MLNPEVSTLAHPAGYGVSRVLYDAALTRSFDEAGGLLIDIGWLVHLAAVVISLLRHAAVGGASR